MLRDVQYFNARIGRLDGAARLGDKLVQIVAEKRVQAQQRPASPADPSEVLPSPVPLEAPSANERDEPVAAEEE